MKTCTRAVFGGLCAATILTAGAATAQQAASPLSTLTLPAGFRADVFAEKVENERQVVDILELDVGMGQGHLFGEPRAIKEQVLAETDPPAEFLRSTLRSAERRRRFH